MLVENEFKKLKTFDSIYFRGKSHFDGTQNYLVYQPMYRYFIRISGVVMAITFISGNLKDIWWKINYIKISDSGITPYLSYYSTNKIRFILLVLQWNNTVALISNFISISCRNNKYLHCL